jgi:hypothetical protein
MQPATASSILPPPQVIKTVDLPGVEKTEAGPLHTIVTDLSGNIYYSDEFNHSVVSLDDTGRLRWFRSRRGNAPGEFYYPRGLALGWIKKWRIRQVSRSIRQLESARSIPGSERESHQIVGRSGRSVLC